MISEKKVRKRVGNEEDEERITIKKPRKQQLDPELEEQRQLYMDCIKTFLSNIHTPFSMDFDEEYDFIPSVLKQEVDKFFDTPITMSNLLKGLLNSRDVRYFFFELLAILMANRMNYTAAESNNKYFKELNAEFPISMAQLLLDGFIKTIQNAPEPTRIDLSRLYSDKKITDETRYAHDYYRLYNLLLHGPIHSNLDSSTVRRILQVGPSLNSKLLSYFPFQDPRFQPLLSYFIKSQEYKGQGKTWGDVFRIPKLAIIIDLILPKLSLDQLVDVADNLWITITKFMEDELKAENIEQAQDLCTRKENAKHRTACLFVRATSDAPCMQKLHPTQSYAPDSVFHQRYARSLFSQEKNN